MYKVNYYEGKAVNVQRLDDGAYIGISLDNRDYQQFLKWQEAQPIESKLDLSDKEYVAPEQAPSLEDRISKIEQQLAQIIERLGK